MTDTPTPTTGDNDQVRLLTPADIRSIAAELLVTPTKKLGQNFLHDPNTVRRIVAAADIDPSTDVIEVGPGLGSLTLGLVDIAHSVTAVEIDERLATKLPATMNDRAGNKAAKLAVIHADAMEVSAAAICAAAPTPPTALVANLPYNVAVPVLLHLLSELPSLRRVLVMVQKEVADRLAANPGTKTYGVPSVKAGFYGQVSRAAVIGKRVFWPEPNVDSALVRIDCFGDTAPWPMDEATRTAVFRVVDAAFAQRRKTLRAALGQYFSSATVARDILAAAGIDDSRRGETLSVEEFVHLGRCAAAHPDA